MKNLLKLTENLNKEFQGSPKFEISQDGMCSESYFWKICKENQSLYLVSQNCGKDVVLLSDVRSTRQVVTAINKDS